jgi:hypothetical protein
LEKGLGFACLNLVNMKQGSNSYMQIYEGPPSVLETKVKGLTPGESYQFQITVSNVDQTSDSWPSNALLTVGAAPQAPGIPIWLLLWFRIFADSESLQFAEASEGLRSTFL